MGGWVGDSQSQFALDGGSQHGELEVDEAQVEDASVRALRPRSSRRGSWESEASGWSAKVAMVRERSLKASSWKAGTLTDGDGSVELAGEDFDGLDGRGVHGPSPLAANGFIIVDAAPSSTEEEAKTPPARDTPEPKFLEQHEAQDGNKEMEWSHVPEQQRTPTKKSLSDTNGPGCQEEEETQKLPLTGIVVSVTEARRASDEATVD